MPWTEQWLTLDTTACSIGRTLELVGEKWTLLILREAMNGVRRFEVLQRRLGAPRGVLASRLGRLVERGLLERSTYREHGQRARQEYHLTAKGHDLRPVLVALMQYGDHHLADAEGPPVALVHRDCDAPVGVALVCAEGHLLRDRGQLRAQARPGARRLAT
ncbi:MAG: helix-turn-helix domain-containing protein [Mycobacteriales bacterium]